LGENNRDDVLKVLRTLVSRALIRQKRTHGRGKRCVLREQPHEGRLPEAVAAREGLTTAAGQLLPGAKEFLEALLPVLRPVDPRAIDIVEMRLQGLSNNEIADQLGIGPRMVQVIRQKMRAAWEQAHRGDNTDAL
jgi:DNA-binding NarL/FixJ family response regulator